mmetsp:Transcript_11280/g.17118  ORF Transcript_11280/g.17118 Transcript_11280/m.17118 type:complete len:109 (+) Transcript_11280:1892-2218(+)
MADIVIKASIGEYGYVKRKDRERAISMYEKSVRFLKDYDRAESIQRRRHNHRYSTDCSNLGMEYGKMRLWRKAHEMMERTIEFLHRHEDIIPSSKDFCTEIASLVSSL